MTNLKCRHCKEHYREDYGSPYGFSIVVFHWNMKRGLHQSFRPKSATKNIWDSRVCDFQRSNIMLPVVVCAAVSIIAQNTNSFSLSEKDLGYQQTCLPMYKVFPSKQVLYSEFVLLFKGSQARMCNHIRKAMRSPAVLIPCRGRACAHMETCHPTVCLLLLLSTFGSICKLVFKLIHVPETIRWHCLISPPKKIGLVWLRLIIWI